MTNIERLWHACPEGNDDEVEQKMQSWMTTFQKRLGVDKRRPDFWECQIRWAVEARRESEGTEQEQGKEVRFREEEQSEETRAQSTDQP